MLYSIEILHHDTTNGLDIVPDVPDADITSPGDIAKSVVTDKLFSTS